MRKTLILLAAGLAAGILITLWISAGFKGKPQEKKDVLLLISEIINSDDWVSKKYVGNITIDTSIFTDYSYVPDILDKAVSEKTIRLHVQVEVGLGYSMSELRELGATAQTLPRAKIIYVDTKNWWVDNLEAGVFIGWDDFGKFVQASLNGVRNDSQNYLPAEAFDYDGAHEEAAAILKAAEAFVNGPTHRSTGEQLKNGKTRRQDVMQKDWGMPQSFRNICQQGRMPTRLFFITT